MLFISHFYLLQFTVITIYKIAIFQYFPHLKMFSLDPRTDYYYRMYIA